MSACVGCALLACVVIGGVYLYFKVERLDREITKQLGSVPVEGDDD